MGSPRRRWSFPIRVTHLRDADTLVVEADLGVRVTHELVVRLRGCNAPEASTVAGQQAIAWVQRWLAEHADPDGWLLAITHKDPGDKFGRWLADIETLDNGSDLVTDLVKAGHAADWDGKGERPLPAQPAA